MLPMMIPSATVAIFLLTSAALAAAPGPDNIFVLTQSALHGRKAGIIITIGLCTGLLAHTLLVALGVGVILQTSALAVSALKVIGAAYLVHLALLAIRTIPIEQGNDEIPTLGYSGLYSRGIIMNLTNPKVAVFFLAFLPQFTNAEYGLAITLQIIILGGLFIIMAFFVFTAIACGASLIGKWLTTNIMAQRAINYMAALIYCGLALNIVLT
jgi:threonine/homoserine/homoserine lactone efflux protein